MESSSHEQGVIWRRWKKLLLISAVAVVALILAAYLVLLSLDFNRFKPQIVQAVKQASGLDVTIHGDIAIGFGLDLRVLVHDIDIRNAPWGSRPEMVRIRRCEFNLALLRLIRGILEIEQVFFIEPDFLLETNPSGEFNFRVTPSQGVSSPAPASPSNGVPMLPVKEVLVEKGRFSYRDGRTGETFTKDVNHLVASASNMHGPMHIELQGSLNDRPVRIEGTFGSLAQLIDSKRPWPVELKARLDGSLAVVQGAISDVADLKGLSLKVRTEGPSVSEILFLAGITPPFDPGPFTGHAVMSDDEAGLTLKDIDLRVGTPDTQEIKITGRIADLLSQRGVKLDYRAHGKDLSKLAGPSKAPLSIGGPFAISGRLLDPAPKVFRFSPIRLALREQQMTGSIQLDMADKLPRVEAVFSTSELNLGSVIASDSRGSAWVRALREMGPFALKISVTDPYGKPFIEELDLRAGTDETIEVKVTGSVKDPLALRGMQFFYEIKGKDAARLEEFIGKPLPVKGPFVVSGRFVDASENVIAFDPLEVALGENKLSGMIELNLEADKPLLKTKLSTQGLDPVPVSKPGFLNPDFLKTLSALGPIVLTFTLSDPGGKPALQEASAVIGEENLAEVTIDGSIEDLTTLQGMDIGFAVRGKDAARLDKILGESLPLKGPFSLNGRARDPEPGIYRFEDLKAVLGKNDIRGWVEARARPDPLTLGAEFTSQNIDLSILDSTDVVGLNALSSLGPWSLKTSIAAHTDRVSVESIRIVLGTPDLTEAKVTGTIQDLFAWQGVDLQCSLKGEDPATLVKLTGKALPLTGAFDFSARLIDPKPAMYKVPEFEAHFGDNDLTGSLDLDLTEKKPRLKAEISSQKLDLRPLFAKAKKAEAETDQTKKSRDKIFPSDPLPFERLETLDARVNLKAGQILLPHLALDRVSTDVTLKDGHMETHPFQCGIGGGTVDGRFDLGAGGEKPVVALKLKAEGIDIGAMLDELGLEKYVTGSFGTEINVQSQGRSLSTLMSGLNGRVVSKARDGRISSRYMDILGSGLLREIFRLVNPLSEKEDYSELNCAVHVFDIKDGLANCRTWLADTRYTLLSGRGVVDFKEEKLDLLFALSPKKGIGISGVAELDVSLPGVARSFKLAGTLARPSLAINPGGVAGTIGRMVGGFTVLGPLGLAAGLLDVRVGKGDPCREVLEALEDGTFDSKVPATDQSPSPAPNPASDKYQGH